ncbi:MAG: permease prefix domain 1-containing protein [Eubacteriales bacterium]
MNKIEEYVEKNFNDIPDSERKEQLKQEILQNLNEKVLDLIEQGKSQEDAENKTIIEFGDIDDIKQELSKGIPAERLSESRKFRLRLGYSVCGSALIIGLMIFVNLYYGNQPVWFVYPTFAVLWWPLTMAYIWFKHK